MDKHKRCWIADYGEFAEEALKEFNPDGSEEIKVDGKKKGDPVTIRAWHISIEEAIKLKAHLLHGRMTHQFTVYVKRETGAGSCRKAKLNEWWPDAVNRRKTEKSVKDQFSKIKSKKKTKLVRGRIGTISSASS